MNKVCVILASYNGSKWIKDQIQVNNKSKQKNTNLDLFINDDCSKIIHFK